MRIFALAARGAAMGLFVAGCTGDHASATTGTGVTGTGSSGAGASSAGSSGAGGSAAGDLIDMFCNTVEPLFCQAYNACCTHPIYSFDPQHCMAQAHPLFFCGNGGDRPALEASLQSGATIFDHDRFDACLSRLKSLSAGGAACVEPADAVLETFCQTAFQGQIAAGGACSWVLDGYWVDRGLPCRDGSCDNGVCVPFLKSGDACPFPTPYSDTAKICNWIKGEWCYGDPDAGGAGGSDGGTMAMGTCAPLSDLGEACHPTNRVECKSHNCDTATSKCVLPDSYGAACSSIF